MCGYRLYAYETVLCLPSLLFYFRRNPCITVLCSFMKINTCLLLAEERCIEDWYLQEGLNFFELVKLPPMEMLLYPIYVWNKEYGLIVFCSRLYIWQIQLSKQERKGKCSETDFQPNRGFSLFKKNSSSSFFFKWFLHCVEGFCLLGLRFIVYLEYSLNFSLPLKIILLPIKPYSNSPISDKSHLFEFWR